MARLFAAVLVAFLFSGSALAETFREGSDYRKLDNPVRTETGDRIEVREFFSYACPHCYTFKPRMSRLQQALGDDVRVLHTPVVFSAAWEPLARAYYVAEDLEVTDTVHGAIFVAYHDEGKRLDSRDGLSAVFEQQGVDREAFEAAWDSFAVDTAMRRADNSARRHQVESTPSVAVNGRYLVDARRAGGHENMIRIIEHLVEKERQAGR